MTLKLGIPKGSLQETTIRLFKKAGFDIRISERSYLPYIDDPTIDPLMLRAQEMSEYVENGTLDCGITGNDWIMEKGSSVVKVEELVYAKKGMQPVRWVLAVPKNSKIRSARQLNGKRIATELVNVTKKYLRKKKVKAESGNITTEYFNFNSAEKYSQIKLSNSKIIEIISVTDSDANNWYEVDSLAQDTIFEDMENNSTNDSTSVANKDTAPYILKLKKTSRRFTTYINQNDNTVLRFGAGISDNPDEEVIPNPEMVGSNLPGSPSKLGVAFDPSNFLKTKAFGLAPSNTTLTIKYSYGGGISDNVSSNQITDISNITYEIQDSIIYNGEIYMKFKIVYYLLRWYKKQKIR